MHDLKPCPFCGGEANLELDEAYDYGAYYYYVECHDCEAKSHRVYQGMCDNPVKDQVIKAWNKRT